MVDIMEPQPLRAPELTATRNTLHERFNKLKKWHEEQQERLHSIQEIKQQKQQEEHFNIVSKLGNTKLHEKNVTSIGTTQNCIEVCENSSVEKRSVGGKNLKMNFIFQRTEEKPLKTTVLNGTSFEELLMQKLSHEKSHEEYHELSKPVKKPFLRKGAGLKRYYGRTPQLMQNRKKVSPKKKNQLVTQNKIPQHLITKLKLQRPHCTDIPDSKSIEQVHENQVSVKDAASYNGPQKPVLSSDTREEKHSLKFVSSCDEDFAKHYKDLEKENQIEYVELAEFEMLEEAAENTSFISDCSLVADKTRNDQSTPGDTERQNLEHDFDINGNNNKNQESSDKEHCVEVLEENLMMQSTQLEKLLHTVKARHQVLLNKMTETNSPEGQDTDLNVREKVDYSTESDAEDISSDDSVTEFPATLASANVSSSPRKDNDDKQDFFNDIGSWKDSINLDSSVMSEAGSEVAGDNWTNDKVSAQEPECHTTDKKAKKINDKKEKKIASEQFVEQNKIEQSKEDVTVAGEDIVQREKINLHASYSNIAAENASLRAERYNIQKKTKELEDEIAIFKKENESLIILRKQREQALQQLEKERTEVANYKEEIKKSLEEEVDEGRRQLYRERQNFERYQKMKKDYPDKKEREIIATLRKQVEKLQNDMKRMETKSSADCKRLKNRLSIVEKERDSLKIAVKQLESQRVELLAVLKENQGKKQQVKKAIISLSNDDLPQTSVIKSKSETGCSSYKEESQSKGTDENQSSVVELKNNDMSEAVLEKPNKIAEEPNTLIEIPDENNNSNSSAVGSCDKISLPKKNQKVQFSGIPEDDASSLLNTKKENGQKVEKIYSNGDREITFPSGTRKHISSDGLTITINFYNGDWKQVLPDQRVIYHYAETNTTQTVYPDGSEIIEFSNGQVESHSTDGTKHVVLPDGSKCTFYADGSEQTITVDGTIIKIDENGTEVLDYPNGEREIRNQEFKKRKYPDGTVKILYEDGREETRYSNGRMRIKGKDGDVILDIQLPEL